MTIEVDIISADVYSLALLPSNLYRAGNTILRLDLFFQNYEHPAVGKTKVTIHNVNYLDYKYYHSF